MPGEWRTPGRAEAFAGPPVPTGPEPVVDGRFRILAATADWAVVSKSGNIPCHPSGRYRENTLEAKLRACGGFEEVHFVSRLDRETSGCVLVAKNAEAAGAFGRALMERRVEKTYLCLARGEWTFGAMHVARGWICPAGDEIVRKYRVFAPYEIGFGAPCACGASPPSPASSAGARFAETVMRPLPWRSLGVAPRDAELLRSGRFLAIECRPLTGRTHQIRATVKGLGLEVVGDKLYGPDRAIYSRMCSGAVTADDSRSLLVGRQALHSWRLRFRDAKTGSDYDIVSDPAGMVDDLLRALRQNRASG